MDSKKAVSTLVALALAAALLALLFRRKAAAKTKPSETDWKELYREHFHTQAADMEAAQAKRWEAVNDQTN